MLERRLRLGIGGYLSSRGLRLRDLESVAHRPDDDPAMGQIWEALIGPEDGGHGSVALDTEPFGVRPALAEKRYPR